MLTPEQIRAYQRERVARLLGRKLGLRPQLRVPDEDDAGVPTRYGQAERDYANYQNDDIGTRDVLGNLS